ncbi:hypothetical protein PUV54_15850 [Hyphococcus flavus]|uniref:Uncharacterized protein n=1 Tax=Hyphococcus flavus TaxID=1866326 RepID=A0AAF0CFI3_9PROT|nr:hypothetical protein [Hyphococcus flavus]WDI31424.1 hypothetical protein PUV54_15850 [Hyphococcus flavus]
MGLRIFPVIGDALNFGGRRLETIARVAWLPMVLILVANMVAIFGYLSVIAGRLITFEDIPSFLSAQQLVGQHAARGFENNADAMWAITAGNIIVQTLLAASFMAPLIRYAGLGEKPSPGVIRAPFGPDQLRFIVAGIFSFLFVAVLVFGPIAGASYYSLKYIVEALAQTVATFPDPNSLHTIEISTASATLTDQGMAWLYSHALPSVFAAPFAILLWIVVFLHFSPKNRPNASVNSNAFLRALTTLLMTVVFLGGAYLFFRQEILESYQQIAGLSGEAAQNLAGSPVDAILIFGIVAYLLVNYFNLRLYAYPGVAVCRSSLGLGNTLRVTRGWNIIRLWVILALIGMLLIFVQIVVINGLFLGRLLPWMVNMLYNATAVSSRLVNSGVTAEWVLPTFIWVWNITKIIINLVWSFFSFGVTAGLYGRLYRESEAGA